MDTSSEEEVDLRIESLLQERQNLTAELLDSPYDLITYLKRAVVHSHLSYPDLAAGDAYKALLLTDEVRDESFEYHTQALEVLQQHFEGPFPEVLDHGTLASSQLPPIEGEDETTKISNFALLASIRCYQILSLSLLLCGCLKSARKFCDRGLSIVVENKDLLETSGYINTVAERRIRRPISSVNDLPDWGTVRREVYPWNDHEPNRFSDESLDILNQELVKMAPKCVVQVANLPVLLDGASATDNYSIIPTCNQLGLFAKEDIAPGEVVLEEYSLVTASNRLKESVCDACSSELPALGSESTAINCPECYDTVFCDQHCFEMARTLYHPAVCENDVDSIAKDPEAKKPTKPYISYYYLAFLPWQHTKKSILSKLARSNTYGVTSSLPVPMRSIYHPRRARPLNGPFRFPSSITSKRLFTSSKKWISIYTRRFPTTIFGCSTLFTANFAGLHLRA